MVFISVQMEMAHNILLCVLHHISDPFSPFSSSSGLRVNESLVRKIVFNDGADSQIEVMATYLPDGSYTMKVSLIKNISSIRFAIIINFIIIILYGTM